VQGAYTPRLIDPLVAELIEGLPAVLVVGPRAVGKTTTARQFCRSELRLDHEPTALAVQTDPDAVLRGLAEPVLVDEWQAAPGVLGAIKRAVDDDSRPGRFLVTGSVRGDLDAQTWPGTGRLVRVAMHGLTPAEILGYRKPTPFLDRVTETSGDDLPRPPDPPDLRGYIEMALRSGFPEPALRLPDRLRERWLESYLDQLLTRDAEQLQEHRDPVRLRRYFEALAINTAGVVDHKTIYDAAGVSRKTADGYEQLLRNLLVLDAVPAWEHNRLKRLVRAPKRYLADPALVASALRVGADAVLRDVRLLGRILDTFVLAQLRAELPLCKTRPRLYHLRSADGRQEIDIVAELARGMVIGIEIKAGAPRTADARHLAWLRDEIGDRFLAGVIVHTGPLAYRLGDRITAVPIAALWS
jgi:predicted AAA+ superfamily ATPase